MLKYLFYRIYRFQIKVIGEEKSRAAYSAFIGIATFWAINLFSVFAVFDKTFDLLGILDQNIHRSNIVVPLIMLAILAITSYSMFYRNSKYEQILCDIEAMDKSTLMKYNLLTIAYQILSLVLIIVALIYRFS